MEPGDLDWLLPIADQYEEGDLMLSAMERLLAAWVIPGKALLCFLTQPDGIQVCGLTDRNGLRYLLALGHRIRREIPEERPPMYAELREMDKWQARVFEQLGFEKDGNRLWLRS
jgi:hypothetical protein